LLIGRVSFWSTRYILVNRKETLPVNKGGRWLEGFLSCKPGREELLLCQAIGSWLKGWCFEGCHQMGVRIQGTEIWKEVLGLVVFMRGDNRNWFLWWLLSLSKLGDWWRCVWGSE
jgi:hypothetical protein